MRVRKVGHQKTRSNLPNPKPINAIRLLHASLCDKYNHSNKYYYLRQMIWANKKTQNPNSIRMKDYQTYYDSKQILEKYIDRDTNDGLIQEVINYYKYYEDIPRIHLNGFERIIQKHVEAKRVKRYSDLNLIVQQVKEDNQTQSYSQFIPLLDFQNKTKNEEDTLMCLKEQLSYLLQEKSWIQPFETPNTKILSNQNTKKCTDIQQIPNQIKIKRRNWGSVELSNPPMATRDNIKQMPQKQMILRFKTMNTPSSVEKMSINEFNRRLCSNENQITRNFSKAGKIRLGSSASKSRVIPMHARMHSQPFCNNNNNKMPVNMYLTSALEIQKGNKVSRLKRKRKYSNLLQKQSIRV